MSVEAQRPSVSDPSKRPAAAKPVPQQGPGKVQPRGNASQQGAKTPVRDALVRTAPAKPPVDPARDAEEQNSSRAIFLSEALPAAVASALKGASVRYVRPGGEVVDLQVSQSMAGLAVQFGSARFTVAVPFGADPAVVITRAVRIAAAAPAPLRARLTGLESDGGNETYTLSGPGSASTVRIERGAVANGKATYAVKAPGVCLALTAPADRDVGADVVGLAGILAEQPEALRGALRRVTIDPAGSPVDEYWANTFKQPGFQAAGTAGTDDVTFWHAPAAIDEGHITHEFGHLVSRHFAADGNYVPTGWDTAVASDPTQVSSYGHNNGAEDFAESWRLYAAARAGRPAVGGDPSTLDEFAARFPARARILNGIVDGSRAALTPIGAPCAPPVPAALPAPAATTNTGPAGTEASTAPTTPTVVPPDTEKASSTSAATSR